MNNIFILQNFLAKQVSGKINYLDDDYWQNKKITGSDILKKTRDFTLSISDFSTLSIDDAKKLGFSLWSKDQPDLFLIPSYLWRFLPKGLEVYGFDGELKVLESFLDIDNDERFGCLAYGIKIYN